MEFLKYFAQPDMWQPFSVVLAGVTYPRAEYHIRRACSKVYVMEYVVRGAGYVYSDGVWQKVLPGSVYLLDAGQRHDYYADRQDPFEKIFLNMKGAFFERLLKAYGLSGKHFFPDSGLEELFCAIPEMLRSNTPEGHLQAQLQGQAICILSRLSQTGQRAKHSQEALRLKYLLDSNLHRQVSGQELGGEIFRSPDYCLKLFSREFGVTPYQYQLQQKMQKAKALLADTTMSVSEVSEALGYADPHYFSNLFQQKCGVRPLQYRKTYLSF